MPSSNNNPQQSATSTQLYELLLARNFEIDILDASGQQITDPTKAEVFSFDYRTENKDYGTVVILLTPDNTLEIFYGNNLGRGMERADREAWYDFLYQVRMFAKRNLFSFELKNMNKLKYTMQGMAALKEGLFEGYYGNKKTSYSDGPQKTRLIINHNKQLEANDPRYRYIESIFVETADGERFKLPFTKLAAGRAMARHVAEGGRPYDPLGQHICSVVETINKLGKFVRKLGRREMTAETELATSAHEKYNEARKLLKRLSSAKGYNSFKESWNPSKIDESDSVVAEVDLLLHESYSTMENKNMKELQLFESWVTRVAEGHDSALDTPEKIQTLVDLLSEPLEVGPDAMNAQELLYDLLGDDALFDQLSDLAQRDPTADARDIVIDWMRQAQHANPQFAEVLAQVDNTTEVAEEIGDPLDDPEFYGDDDDDEDTSEFYVVIYDEDEDNTFVGKLEQSDRRWEEIAVAGPTPAAWGGGYMSYVSPQDIMNWLYQDYGRGYTVKGPYYNKQEALQVAHNQFGIREDTRSEFQANLHLGSKRKLPNKQFTDFAEWRKYMTSFEPAVKFFKKTTPHGEIIVARDGDRVLGSYSPANKFGFIGEAAAITASDKAIREFKEFVSKIV